MVTLERQCCLLKEIPIKLRLRTPWIIYGILFCHRRCLPSLEICQIMQLAGFNIFLIAIGLGSTEHHSNGYLNCPESEFLSDAPFFRLSPWTEFKLANCACASGWSCLMNLDLRSKFWLFLSYLGSFVGVSSCWPCSSKKELCTL